MDLHPGVPGVPPVELLCRPTLHTAGLRALGAVYSGGPAWPSLRDTRDPVEGVWHRTWETVGYPESIGVEVSSGPYSLH